MALDKQNASIPFGRGIDTKTDKNQVSPDKLLLLKDARFIKGNILVKRDGEKNLLGTGVLSSSAYGIATFKKELITLDARNLSSYNQSNQSIIQKGYFAPVDISTSPVIADNNEQINQDSAYNQNGNLYLHTYVDSSLGSSYIVIDANTNQQVLKGSLAARYVKPRAFSVGNYLVIVAIDNSTSPFTLSYFPILTTNPASPTATNVASTVSQTYPNFAGIVAGDALYLSWNGTGPSVRTAKIDSEVTLQGLAIQNNEDASGCINVFSDETRNQTYIWTAYYDGNSEIRYFVQDGLNLGNVLAPTSFLSNTRRIINVSGYARNGEGNLYFQSLNTYDYQINGRNVRTDYIARSTVNESGTVGSSAMFIRSVALASKVAVFNGQPYFLTAYGANTIGASTANHNFQPTYFLLRGATSGTKAEIIGKLDRETSGGYSSSSLLTSFNQVAGSKHQFSYIHRDVIASQAPSWDTSGGVYYQMPGAPFYSRMGVRSAMADLYNPSSFSFVEMGDNLNVNGGILWAYDGQAVTENNFHLFPEDIRATTASSAGGILAGTYSYLTTYEWKDRYGNVHRSAPSLPCSVEVPAGTSAQIQIDIPNLRLTTKQNVSIVNYRTTPTISTSIYTRINSPTAPLVSSTASDSVSFTDFIRDSDLNGNALVYTTGGVLDNAGPPAFAFVGRYRNRLMGLSAENRNQWWFSKEVLENTPVEMSAEQTIFVDEKYGEMTCGIEMDDKWIIFHPSAIQYLVGQGPDATGAQNDFSEVNFIDSTVGTIYPKSIVLTPMGVMFKSAKGIWLLSRNLSVSYIGAPVEAYNEYEVTSAILVPGTTEIRFSLGNDQKTILVYDYYYDQWGVFTGKNVLAAVSFSGIYTFVSAGSSRKLLQETPGIYSDQGKPILMGLKTAWLSMAGFQGFQRAYRLYFLGEYKSPHKLMISVAYDFKPGIVQTGQVRVTPHKKYGDDKFYGSGDTYGGESNVEQYRFNLKEQKCQSIQVTIEEALDSSNYELGAGLNLEAINLVYGIKRGYPKLSDAKSVT